MVLGTIAAGLLGIQAVRFAAVADLHGPRLADAVWPSHPQRVIDRELAAIGTAAGRGSAPDDASLARVEQVAPHDPLASQPYLVAGTAALAKGDRDHGNQLLAIAIRHDPRDPSARLLLATSALQTGKLTEAMPHIAVLSRLIPAGAASLGPALAAFARQPGAAARLTPLLKADPTLRSAVLTTLASDSSNAGLVLQLAGEQPVPRADAPLPEYQSRLVAALVQDGQFNQAHRLWERFTGIHTSAVALNDPGFTASTPVPPFGWTLTSGPEGSAEADGKGGLQILYYGRSDTIFASQITVLPPGSYRLGMQASGGGDQAGNSVAWTVSCAKVVVPIARLVLRGSGTRALAMTFTVPAGCPAQTVTLNGTSPEFPGTVAVTVRDLTLAKVAG